MIPRIFVRKMSSTIPTKLITNVEKAEKLVVDLKAKVKWQILVYIIYFKYSELNISFFLCKLF